MAKNTVVCPVCRVEEIIRPATPGESPVALHEIGDFRCDACGARTVYGRLMPRVVVEPTRGEHDLMWIRIRRQDPSSRADVHEPLDLDPKMAVELAKNILSLVRV